MKKYLILALVILVLFIHGCKSSNTGNMVKDLKDTKDYFPDKETDNSEQALVNYTNQTYYVNKTLDKEKEARARINDAKEEISKTVLTLKEKIDKNLISNRRKQKAEKLINSAELLLAKSEESYKNGLYENSSDLAVDSKIKIFEAQSVIG